jgi:hypothetical protein
MNEVPKDWAETHANGGAAIREAADRVWADSLKIHRKPAWRDQVFTAAELQNKQFPPVRYVVPNLIPEGLTLLCGRPKVGKSWAALEIAISVASEADCFGGRQTEQGDVLYAALEDNPRRLQRRIDSKKPTTRASSFSTRSPASSRSATTPDLLKTTTALRHSTGLRTIRSADPTHFEKTFIIPPNATRNRCEDGG